MIELKRLNLHPLNQGTTPKDVHQANLLLTNVSETLQAVFSQL